jgi:hypothetical protein
MPMNPRLLVPRATFDPDAAAYLRAVEAADGQALETPVKRAVDDFFKGCKADGTFSALNAACLLCGARTLAGALVPLVGTAPTNNNFVDADYNRETGLVGNGSTKYLDSNRSNNADLQNNKHVAILVSSLPILTPRPMLGLNRPSNVGNATLIYDTLTRLNTSATFTYTASAGFIGLARSEEGSYVIRNNSINESVIAASETPVVGNIVLFADNLQSVPSYSYARLAFYSIGESLDLALLDARVTALVNAIGAAL